MFSSSSSQAKRRLLFGVGLQLLLISQLIHCLRVGGGGDGGDEQQQQHSRPQRFDRSESDWKTVEIVDEFVSGQSRGANNRDHSPQSREKKAKKLIEWDDDDNNNNNNNNLTNDLIQGAKDSTGDLSQVNLRFQHKAAASNNLLAARRALKPSHTSGLVFHGQLKQNTTIKLNDGIKIHINTHQPVSISRKSSSSSSGNGDHSSPIIGGLIEFETETSSIGAQIDRRWSESLPDDGQLIATSGGGGNSSSQQPQQQPHEQLVKLGSDWKPIVSSPARSRRSGKTHSPAHSDRNGQSNTNGALLLNVTVKDSIKWKPIKSGGKRQDSSSAAAAAAARSSQAENSKQTNKAIVYGGKKAPSPSSSYRLQRISSRVEEPFEPVDEGLIISEEPRDDEELREAKSHRRRQTKGKQRDISPAGGSRWTPVQEATTMAPITTTTTTTTEEPTTTTTAAPLAGAASSSSNSSSIMELAAHRSASDLNYIYSSQPDSSAAASSSRQQASYSSNNNNINGYYSNYLIQPAPEQATAQQLGATIIDSTSGQTPEMIVERVPDSPAAPPAPASMIYEGGYSAPQASASFQPVQAPSPPRLPQSSYGPSNYYDYNPRSVQPQQQQPPIRSQPSAPAPAPAQVVRQEHHYHYYNQQQPQQQQQQQDSRQLQTSIQQPTSQIIRELQPMLITQPIIQQQQPATSTTTTTPQPPPPPPPQIIREIIREVPMQPLQQPQQPQPQAQQFARIVPIPVPSIRELEPAGGAYQFAAAIDGSPAQRIIRQLSNSMPSVSMRMPQLAPIRLPLPSLQLPIRLSSSAGGGGGGGGGAPVTRQAGSFVIPPMPKKTTTYLTETQAMPVHTTIMQTTQFTPATRTTVFTTDHQPAAAAAAAQRAAQSASNGYK